MVFARTGTLGGDFWQIQSVLSVGGGHGRFHASALMTDAVVRILDAGREDSRCRM
jgi:hypothetical protein